MSLTLYVVFQARAAYEETYGKYHGFLVRQIFQNTFDAAPPQSVILQHMNRPKLQNILECDETTLHDDDDDDVWIQIPVDRVSIRSLPPMPQPPPEHPFLDFIGNVFKENILMKLGQCLGMEGRGHPSLNMLAPSRASLSALNASGTCPASTANEPDKDVSTFLYITRPFLHGLDNLLEELCLNDPSRV